MPAAPASIVSSCSSSSFILIELMGLSPCAVTNLVKRACAVVIGTNIELSLLPPKPRAATLFFQYPDYAQAQILRADSLIDWIIFRKTGLLQLWSPIPLQKPANPSPKERSFVRTPE